MNEVKYSFFKSFSKPILDVTDNFLKFLKYASIAASFLVVLSFIFGQSFLCMFSNIVEKTNLYCSNDTQYFVYLLFKFFILSIFIKVWYDSIYLKCTINIQYFKSHISDFFKTFGILLLFCFLNILPILSLILLLYREPNPIWQFETFYFTVVSIGFLIPFLLTRFYTNIAEMIEGTDYKNFKEIYKRTSFKMGKITLALSFILLLSLFLFVLMQSNLKTHAFEPLMIYNIIAEFIFELTIIFITALFLNFIRVQKELLTNNI